MSRPDPAPAPPTSARSSRGAADEAAREEQDLRARWEERQEELRLRFEVPITRAARFTRRTMAWFPVRVWRNFLGHDGFILAAGISYQTLFATFAAIYVAFAIAGLWLGGDADSINELIRTINNFVPGLISTGDDQPGVVSAAAVQAIAAQWAGTLTITLVIALGTLIWTAIGAISYARRAVRSVFGIPPDKRNYFLLKFYDLLAAIVFGAGLIAGTLLGTLGTWALSFVFGLVGISSTSTEFNLTVRLVTLAALYVVNVALMAGLFRFLTGTQLTWRRILPGAFLGAAATTVLQLGFGLFLSYTPSNPLLATFTIFIVLLLWFRLIGIVLLVAASWIAVSAQDKHIALLPVSEAQRLAEEHKALLLAAQVRLRTAEEARTNAPWYRRWSADRAVHDAYEELEQVKAATPPPPVQKKSFFAPRSPAADGQTGAAETAQSPSSPPA